MQDRHHAPHPQPAPEILRFLVLLYALLTSFGVPKAHAISEHMTNAQLCQAAGIVMVGKVTDVDSTAANGTITSVVTFDVERMVHGPNVSTLGVFVYSGKDNGAHYALGSTPLFEVGDRYLLLLHPRQGLAPTIIGAGSGAIRLDASALLPSLQDLQGEWDEVCDA